MGGRGVLTWLNSSQSEATPVRSVIGVYPGCGDQRSLTTHVPLLLLLGGADDIADPRICERLLAESSAASEITVHVYPGARHGFDVSAAPPVLDIGGGMTIGYQPAAAESAWREIFAFFKKAGASLGRQRPNKELLLRRLPGG
jgi:dienelactone hydrolase